MVINVMHDNARREFLRLCGLGLLSSYAMAEWGRIDISSNSDIGECYVSAYSDILGQSFVALFTLTGNILYQHALPQRGRTQNSTGSFFRPNEISAPAVLPQTGACLRLRPTHEVNLSTVPTVASVTK